MQIIFCSILLSKVIFLKFSFGMASIRDYFDFSLPEGPEYFCDEIFRIEELIIFSLSSFAKRVSLINYWSDWVHPVLIQLRGPRSLKRTGIVYCQLSSQNTATCLFKTRRCFFLAFVGFFLHDYWSKSVHPVLTQLYTGTFGNKLGWFFSIFTANCLEWCLNNRKDFYLSFVDCLFLPDYFPEVVKWRVNRLVAARSINREAWMVWPIFFWQNV